MPFSELLFGQTVAVSHSWIYVEGVAFGRLNAGVVERLSKIIGFPITIVPELKQSIENGRQRVDLLGPGLSSVGVDVVSLERIARRSSGGI